MTTERVILKSVVDGKAVNLDWYVSTDPDPDARHYNPGSGVPTDGEDQDEADMSPIIVLVHGIAGNSNEGYMCRLAHSFLTAGFVFCEGHVMWLSIVSGFWFASRTGIFVSWFVVLA